MLNTITIFLDISGGEFIVILITLIIVLGPKKIPQIIKIIKHIIKEANKVTSSLKNEIELNNNIYDSESFIDENALNNNEQKENN
ncbi:MAG TPA: hypothetical protein P5250_02095 [Bacteroidales bacterium]|nr:hypothetical protein [Bacteroidales bacterium]